jgi:hypothetical protein
MRRALIIFPPLLLVVVGLIIYGIVTAITTPHDPILRAQPLSTPQSSTTASPSAEPVLGASTSRPQDIVLVVRPLTSDEIAVIQAAITAHQEQWRTTPLEAARGEGVTRGFSADDAFALSGAVNPAGTLITVTHNNRAYVMTMIEQVAHGAPVFWSIGSIVPQ